MRLFVLFPTLLFLSACGGETSQQASGSTSPSEDAALNDAAEMLDQSEADGNTADPAQ